MRDWAGLVVFSVLTAYTHYTTCLAVAWVWLFLGLWCIRKRCLTRWVKSALVVVLAYSPWLLIMIKVVLNSGVSNWIPPLSAADIFELLLLPTRDVLLMLVLVVIAVLAYAQWRHTRSVGLAHALFGWTMVFSVVLTICGISLISSPIITPRTRYIVPMLGCLWLGSIVALELMRRVRLQLLLAVVMLFVAISEVQSFCKVQLISRAGTDALCAFIAGDPAAELIIGLQAPSTADPTPQRAITRMTGKRAYVLRTELPPMLSVEDKMEDAMQRIHLPDTLRPLVREIAEEASTSNARVQQYVTSEYVRSMLDAGKNVYCIAMRTPWATPAKEKTAAFLARAGVQVQPEPAVFYISGGNHKVELYRLTK